jgi:starvation-inducible DNA-binding protein
MEKTNNQTLLSAQPRFDQNTPEIQAYSTVNHLFPLQLEEPMRQEMTECLNQLLADTITLRELYKKSPWQVAGSRLYEIHLLFDKHNELQILSEQLFNVPIVEA